MTGVLPLLPTPPSGSLFVVLCLSCTITHCSLFSRTQGNTYSSFKAQLHLFQEAFLSLGQRVSQGVSNLKVGW